MNNEEKVISKEQTWKGLKMELPIEELDAICQQKYEKDEYYNYDLFLKGIYKAFNKEVDINYFTGWCVLIANCLYDNNYKLKSLTKLMGDISWFFDGISFMQEWNKKEFLGIIASLNDFNHTYNNLLNKTKLPFETNGIERILTVDHVNRSTNSIVYRVIIKDNNAKQFDIRYFDDYNYEFNEKINYTFVGKRKFEAIFNNFFIEDENWEENHNLKF